MKKLLLVLISGALMLPFTSCKKDGIYTPGKKIDKIYQEVDEVVYDGDEDEYVPTGKKKTVLTENWLWDGNLLKEQEAYYYDEDDGDYYLDSRYQFTYDKNRLARVMETCDEPTCFHGSWVYAYAGNKLDKILNDDGLEISFVYDKNKLSEINYSGGYGGIRSIAPAEVLEPLAMVLDNNVFACLKADETLVSELAECVSNTQKARISGSSSGVKIAIEWNGKNISQMTISFPGISENYVMTMSYDKKINPFRRLLFNSALDYPTSGTEVLMYSANNVTEVKTTMGSYSYTTTIAYEYDGQYPTKETQIHTYNGHTSDPMVRYIHYK
ncbi:MAG: hypothetical protein J5606_07765 [Bacteroidales bacterium]|nr:hypothetical protein [Bacteroidales bacterium]